MTCTINQKKNLNILSFFVMNFGLVAAIIYLWHRNHRDIAFVIVAFFLTLSHLRDNPNYILSILIHFWKSN